MCDCKEEERVGQYVLLKCVKYERFLPQIGKICKLDEVTVTLEWLHGIYTSNFVYWKQGGKPISEEDQSYRQLILQSPLD